MSQRTAEPDWSVACGTQSVSVQRSAKWSGRSADGTPAARDLPEGRYCAFWGAASVALEGTFDLPVRYGKKSRSLRGLKVLLVDDSRRKLTRTEYLHGSAVEISPLSAPARQVRGGKRVSNCVSIIFSILIDSQGK